MAFDFLATWQAVNTKECQAANRERVTKQHQQVWISWCTRPQHLNYCCIAVLEQNSTCLGEHWWPHRDAAKQSEKAIGRQWIRASVMDDHLPAKQSLHEIAPYPTEPAEPEETWRSGMGVQWGDNRKLYPFHDWKNSSHHDKSKWNSLFSLIRWSSLPNAENRLIVRRRKVWPEGMTLHACWRLPIKDSNSFCVQWHFCDQETSSVWIWSNFYWGKCASNRRESSSMPNPDRRVKCRPTCLGERKSPNPGIAQYKYPGYVGTT